MGKLHRLRKYRLKREMVRSYLFGMAILFLAACSSDNAPEPVDCDTNGVSISKVETTIASCGINDGSIVISATGGSGAYTYSLNGGELQASNTFTNLSAGNYSIQVLDDSGCEVQGNATVQSDAGMEISVMVLADAGCGTEQGSIQITGLDGVEPYQYKIEGGTYQDENVIENVSAGLYMAYVKDANGCEVTGEIELLSGTKLQEDIIPIINTNCAVSGCHDGGNGLPNFTNKTNIINNAEKIKTRTGNNTMPPSSSGKTLTDEEIALIACWVDDGAIDN